MIFIPNTFVDFAINYFDGKSSFKLLFELKK